MCMIRPSVTMIKAVRMFVNQTCNNVEVKKNKFTNATLHHISITVSLNFFLIITSEFCKVDL